MSKNNRSSRKMNSQTAGAEFADLQNAPVSGFLKRCLSLAILTTLLAPIFLFQPGYRTSAKTLPIPQTPAIVSPPPAAFIVADNNSSGNFLQSVYGSFLYLAVNTVSRFFDKPQIPAGLEQPENQPTLAASLNTENITSKNSISKNLTVESSTGSNTSLTLPPAQSVVKYDFDGDGKADLGRWKSSAAEWKVKNSSSGSLTTVAIGSNSSIIAPGDFDGDTKNRCGGF